VKKKSPITLSILFVLIVIAFCSSCKSAAQREEDERLSILYHNAGVKLFSDERYDEALKNFESAVKLDRKNAYYINDLALAYSMLREYENAIRYYKNALRIKPEASEIRNGLASAMAMQGNLADAIIQWEKIIDDPLYKSPGMVYYNLGNAYFLLDDIDRSEKNFLNVLKYAPEHIRSLYFLGVIYDRRGNLKDAARYYERSIAADPDFAPSHFNLGVNYFKRSFYDEAMGEFNWIISSSNDEGLKIKAREYMNKITGITGNY